MGIEYRKEIDGLRAFAVLPVIFLHAGHLEWLSGGYLGVDVFFVISGFLITKILLDRLVGGGVSIIDFYDRRMRRLLPALYLVIFVSSIFSWFLMLPNDLENYGQSVVATICFSNNILTYLTSGYWAMESYFKPLVHTWSLGVEEQYYLMAPFLIALAFRKRALFASLMIVFLLSMVLAQYTAREAPSFGFLMIFPRAWELAVGGLAAYLSWSGRIKVPHIAGTLLSAVGLVAILASYVLFHEYTSHPGLITLVPVLGSAMVIMFANPHTLVGKLLSYRPFVLIGLFSYSAYLWHQPVFAFVRITSLEEPSFLEMMPWCGLVLGLSYLTWKYIEAPFRSADIVSGSKFYLFVVFGGGLFLILGLTAHFNAGFPGRYPEISGQEYTRASIAQFNDSAFRYATAGFSDRASKKVVVVGNSFARDFINAAIKSESLSADDIVYLPNLNPCWEVTDVHMDLLSQSDYVVFASDYGENAWNWSCAVDLISDLRDRISANCVIIGPKNFGWNNNAIMLLREEERYAFRAKVLDYVIERNERAKSEVPAGLYVDVMELIIDEDSRVPVFTPNKKLISQDRFHLTPSGAKYLGGLLFEHPLLRELKHQ